MTATVEDLRRQYADVMANPAVTAATHWVPPNTSPAFSYTAVSDFAKNHAAEMREVLQQVFGEINEQ
jgi:hypothetical protein